MSGTISMPSLGMSFDVDKIVTGLMQVEEGPLNRYKSSEKAIGMQISVYGTVKSKLSEFQSTMSELGSVPKFRAYSATVDDDTLLTATADEHSAPGTHEIVVSQLAQANRVSSAAFTDSVTSIGATVGDFTVSCGADSFTITVPSGQDTLADIRNFINNNEDNESVQATLINVDDGVGGSETRLVLTSLNEGAANTISLTDVTGNVAASLDATNQLDAAQDATFTVDGYNVTRPSNLVSDVLDGVSIQLKKTGTANVTVKTDVDTVVSSVKKFVDSYNSLIETIDKYSAYKPEDVSSKPSAESADSISKKVTAKHDLKGDSTLIHIRNSVRDEVTKVLSGIGSLRMLHDVGVSSASSGGSATPALVLDEDQLKSAIGDDFASVSNLFTDKDQGYAVKLETLAKQFLENNGIVDARVSGLEDQKRRISSRIAREETHVDELREQYYDRFVDLGSLLNKFEGVNSFLSTQLSQLSKNSK